MIRFQQPELQPTDNHAAWQASWSDDEERLAHALGYADSLIDISLIKRVLQDETMPPGLRLRFLVVLNKLVRGHLTLQAMQCVTPADDTSMQMLDAMKPLAVEDRSKLMDRWNVIAAFCNLNPSIISAIALFDHSGQQQRSA
jgi:hypothetical protein